MSYPEHEKMHAVVERSQAIGEFLEAAAERGMHLARWTCRGHWGRHELAAGEVRDGDLWYHTAGLDACDQQSLVYVGRPINVLLAEHFGIDLKVIEEEKRAMLDAYRARAAQ